ncbi:MAG TPA: hypothetical protein VGL53_13015 [Bryobacteraceae bacterium]|jgi:hypothetical protein
MHRVYISAPGDLSAEQQLCRTLIGQTNEGRAMEHKILLVAVGLPEEGVIESYRSAVADNIRQCAYHVQVFQDDWGPKNLSRKMFYLSYDGRADDTMPMREVLVFLKDAPRETDPAILAFRKELAELPDVRIFHFRSQEEMRAQLLEVLAGWVEDIRKQQPASASAN